MSAGMVRISAFEEPEAWPLDPPNGVFLGRAIQMLGRAMYTNWSDEDARAIPWPDVQPRDEEAIQALIGHTTYVSRFAYPNACNRVREHNLSLGEAAHRIKGAALRLSEACARGRLRSFYCPADFFRAIDIKPEAWAISDWLDRVRTCQIDSSSPRSGTVDDSISDDRQWIFVSELELGELIASTRARPGASVELPANARLARRAEDLAAQLRDEQYWGLAATLLWIGLRDLGEAALVVVQWRESFPDMADANSLVTMTRTYLTEHVIQGGEVQTTEPDQWLGAALRRAQITATGCERGIEGRRAIPAEQWIDLALSRGPKEFSADAGAFMPGPSPTAGLFWTRLRFHRGEVLATFPGDWSATLETAESTPWHKRPLESQKAWVWRPEVLEEAEKRRKGPSEKKLCEALAQMASEFGAKTWTAGAIESARYRSRPPRQQS